MPAYFEGKLIFIHVPKCAGTSIKTNLRDYQLSLQPDGAFYTTRLHESLLEVQSWFLNKWGPERWEETTIFSTVRHPVERVVSWWKFIREINMQNHLIWQKVRHAPKTHELEINPLTVPYFLSEDYATYAGKPPGERCHHVTERKYADIHNALSFDEFVKQMTVWKKNGCSYPICPYHALAPQTCWLKDISGEIPMNKLNLFLVEQLEELEQFLPELGSLEKVNVSKKKGENYADYLTTDSLLLLMKYYVEDFELYEALKNKPAKQLKPFYPEK